jgi:TPR repeat protein
MRLTSRAVWAALLIGIGLVLAASPSEAQTRRAFVVGIKNYRDASIQQLSLATQDAEGIAYDLKQIGFEDKNVKLFNNPSSKDAFLSEFNKFVETVKEGDVVFFYFSGHGYGGRGADGQPQNFLLFGDIKSPLEFARSKATDAERKTPQLLLARAEGRELLIDYETIEVPARGISEKDILNRLQQKKPRIAIIVLDACRTLLLSQAKGVGRLVGTNLKVPDDAPQGFMLIYSASHGQQAIEKFGDADLRQNSLFTSVFREYLLKPGLDLTHLAKRVQDKVSQIAQNAGRDQDPDFIDRIRNGDFYFIDPIGADRFTLNDNPCDFAAEDLREIRDRPRRERLERHLRYFASCPTAREAGQLLDVLAHGVTTKAAVDDDEPGKQKVNLCDKYGASEEDSARPPEVPGVSFGQIDPDKAIPACDKATTENSRVVRYLFNLARAYQRKAQVLPDDDPAKRRMQVDAVIRYEDAVKRGYVAAFNNLALMYDKGEGVDRADPAEATRLLQLGAKQGHAMAMYNLALRYRSGQGGLTRESTQAYELFAKAAEAGNVAAMVRVGVSLWVGSGVRDADPVRALEWLRRAANAGSDEAKRYLGIAYLLGGRGASEDRNVQSDPAQSLLWFAQAAEEGDSDAQRYLAKMLEDGSGLTTQQPQLAERYWRLAAYNGNVDAQVEFAERILSSRVLIKPENGPGEVVQLLQQAMTLGSSRAALRLAKLYRTGEFGYAVRPEEAVKYAYRAIDLATQTTGTTGARASTFDNPLDEIAAGILLAEMAANGEAVNRDGQPLLTQQERERLERYYGRPDPETKKVKVRSLKVWMSCGGRLDAKYLWIWDWGREEPPTEQQFRYYETQSPACIPYMDMVGRDGRRASTRDTLKALWDAVRKDKTVSFPDIVAAQAEAAAVEQTQGGQQRRRR